MLHLLSPEALIIKMQSQNIKFEKTTVNDAIKYLTYNTYYKKISSYKKNFSYSTPEKEKRYLKVLENILRKNCIKNFMLECH